MKPNRFHRRFGLLRVATSGGPGIPRCGLLALLLVSCSSCRQPAATASGDGGEAGTFAQAQLRVEQLRQKPQPDWAAVGQALTKLMPTVQRLDRRLGTRYRNELQAALADCMGGRQVAVQQQVLAKGLQHVAVLAIRAELDELQGLPAEDDPRVRRITAFYEGLRPTVVRRDRNYFADRQLLEQAGDQALGQLQQAVRSGPHAIPAARRGIEELLGRVYALSVLYEAEEMERIGDRDPERCAVKQKEAELFLRILAPRLQQRVPPVADTLRAFFERGCPLMRAREVEEVLAGALDGGPLR